MAEPHEVRNMITVALDKRRDYEKALFKADEAEQNYIAAKMLVLTYASDRELALFFESCTAIAKEYEQRREKEGL